MKSLKICKTCFAGKLVAGIETRFAGRKTRFAGSSTKIFIFIIVVKQITCNSKVVEIMSFCDFFSKKNMQAAVISIKKKQLTGVILEIESSV